MKKLNYIFSILRNNLSIRKLVVSTFILILFSNPVLAEPENSISMSSVILFAVNNNPDIELSKEKEIQSKTFITDAKSAFYPQVKFTASFGREYNKPVSSQNTNNSHRATLTIKQLLFDGFATSQGIKSQENVYISNKIKTKIKIQKVISSTIKIYLDIMREQKSITEIKEYNDNVRKIAKNVNKRYAAGDSSKASKSYVAAQIAQADSELAEIKAALNDSISNLEYITGYIPAFKAKAPEKLDTNSLADDFYSDYAKKNNYRMVLNGSNKYVLKHRINAAKGLFAPKFDLNIGGELKDNNGGKVGFQKKGEVLVRMNYQIFDGFSRSSNIKKLESQYNELNIRDIKIFKKLKKDIKLAYNQITLIEDNLIIIDKEIKANEEIRKINDINFKYGDVSIIDLLDGERKLKDSKLKKHKMNSDLYYNSYKMLIDSGIVKRFYFCETCRNL